MNTPTMADRVEEYLAYRRALGYQLRIEGQLLQSFARYADDSGHRGPADDRTRPPLGPPAGAGGPAVSGPRGWKWCGPLARYLAPREPGTEVPPRGLARPGPRPEAGLHLLRGRHRRADRGGPVARPGRRPAPRTYATLIGLMACTGLRITEALTLRAGDVDLESGVLTVRQTKFRKSRLVPLHASAIGPLRDYAAVRDGRHRQAGDTTFFVSDAGRPLPYSTVRHTFHRLCDRPCPGVVPAGRDPAALHDLRHTFVCRRLLAWYRDGTDIDRAIDQLSAYLGHAKVTDTYWYLTGIPELLALAGRRFEQFAPAPARRLPMTPPFDTARC